MFRIATLLLAGLTVASALGQTGPVRVPVSIEREEASFRGALLVSATGPEKKVSIRWEGQIQNTSDRDVFRAEFCIRGYNRPGGTQLYGCLFRLWGSNWKAGSTLTFQGKDRIQFRAKVKDAVEIQRYAVTVEEILERPPNLRVIEARCPLVWNPAIQTFAEKDFHPKVMDKDSFTGSFDYAGGLVNDARRAEQHLKSFTQANTRLFGPDWGAFRVDNASIYLRESEPGTCEAEIRMSFAGYGKPFMQRYYSWYKVESSFAFEKDVLDEIEKLALRAQETDMDRAISRLPAEAPPPEPLELVELVITSEPPGAEIEINDEWIGSTPTTVKVDAGKKVLRIRSTGRPLWERTFSTNPGDKRSIHVELTP